MSLATLRIDARHLARVEWRWRSGLAHRRADVRRHQSNGGFGAGADGQLPPRGAIRHRSRIGTGELTTWRGTPVAERTGAGAVMRYLESTTYAVR